MFVRGLIVRTSSIAIIGVVVMCWATCIRRVVGGLSAAALTHFQQYFYSEYDFIFDRLQQEKKRWM